MPSEPAAVIQVSQMFLVPAAILFGALGVAPTEQLKTLISALGLLTSAIWFYRIWMSVEAAPIDQNTTLALAAIFIAVWLISLVAHGRLWYRKVSTASLTPRTN